MNGKGVLNTLKNRFLRSVYRHDPHGRGITGKVIAALLIFDFILFVIVFYICFYKFLICKILSSDTFSFYLLSCFSQTSLFRTGTVISLRTD